MTDAPSLPDPERSRVVLAGAHTYEYLENLPAVGNNLKKLREALTDSSICGFSPDSTTVLEQSATPNELLDATYDAADSCTDTLIFYFAGHGLTSQRYDDLLLAIPGTEKRRPHTAVRFDDVRQAILSARKAVRKVVILDCCFSGRAMIGSMQDATDLAARSDIEGSYILTAASETKAAISPPGETLTAFTFELIDILQHGIQHESEHLSMGAIYDSLHARLSGKGRPTPQQRNRNAGSKIILARNKSFTNRQDRINAVYEYMIQKGKEEREALDPAVLQKEAETEHLSYGIRINKAKILGETFPEFRGRALRLLYEMMEAPDLCGRDFIWGIEAFGLLSPESTGGLCDALTEIAMARENRDAYRWSLSDRIAACRALRKLGAENAATHAMTYMMRDNSLNMADQIGATRAALKSYPEAENSALQRLWDAGEDESAEKAERITALQILCEFSPESLDAATILIKKIRAS
ncbi:caspase, EACC1-associated type [Streptomyces luteogriseus]|uniref:caspase, EACC1-associated type n=1 Tax=Streptomyces luteogriseus TaxID=68233 RepID=UPI0036A11DCA